MQTTLLIGILACAAAIAFQDFKSRLISLWLLVVFSVLVLVRSCLFDSMNTLGENFLFCLSYGLLTWSIIMIYLYIKTKTLSLNILSQLGGADIWLLMIIGSTLEPIRQIYFYTLSFCISLLCHVMFSDKNKTVPLGAYLCILFSFQLIAQQMQWL